MCLGKLYTEQGTQPLLENVASFTVDQGKLVFTTLFGEEETFSGELKKIDFSNSRIIISQ